MRIPFVPLVATVLILAGSLAAHSLFLKLENYFLPPHSPVAVQLINGEFDRSDNVITRDRMLDVSVVGPEDQVTNPPKTSWRYEDKTTILDLETGPPGTYCIGVSTAARVTTLEAEKFNRYLRNDGVLDHLEERKRKGLMEQDARESYAKHVKAIIQVGDRPSEAYATRLGYPVEIVPLQNPYQLRAGDELDVLVLKEGQPLPNQLLYGSFEGFHLHGSDGEHIEAVSTRTDAQGQATIPLHQAGRWYLRLIHMVTKDEPDLDYASEWATVTFQIRPKAPPTKAAPQSDPEDPHATAVPWLWIGIAGGSALAIGLLLFIARSGPKAAA